MRRLIRLFLLLVAPLVFAEPLRVTTWNLDVETPPRNSRAEEQWLAKIAAVLQSSDTDVIALQEVRDRRTTEKLAALLRPLGYQIAVGPGIREASEGPDLPLAILSRKPVVAAWSESWKMEGRYRPPGGFAFALIQDGANEIAIYSVDFKKVEIGSNSAQETQFNILVREVCAAQLVRNATLLAARLQRQPVAMFIAGTLNTDGADPVSVSEKTLGVLRDAGFVNPLNNTAPAKRITYRPLGKTGGSTRDYLFVKTARFASEPQIQPSELSDHFALTGDFTVGSAPAVPSVYGTDWMRVGWVAGWLVVAGMVVFGFILFKRRNPAVRTTRFARDFRPPRRKAYSNQGKRGAPVFQRWADDTVEANQPGSDGEHQLKDEGNPSMLAMESRAVTAEKRAERASQTLRQMMTPHLLRLMENKLFQGLASQRSHLLRTQETATVQVLELEQRLLKVQSELQSRIAVYERRIAELEQEVAAKDRLNRELIRARLQTVVAQKETV